MLSAAERRKLHQRMPPDLLEATVQDPPLTADGWLRVELDGAPGIVHECPWPRGDGSPEPEDAAAVQESDGGNYWCVAWWPNNGTGGVTPGSPTGPAGGVLSGTYPNPGFAADMATQAELDAEATARAGVQTNLTAEAITRANNDATIQALLNAHTGNVANPHAVTKGQVGLGNVDNTSDAAKPISTAVAAALLGKLDTGTRLDQLAAPTGVVNMNSKQIQHLADPGILDDAASYGSVIAAVQRLGIFVPVAAVATVNLDLATNNWPIGSLNIDGVSIQAAPNSTDPTKSLVPRRRVLLMKQTNAVENGIYYAQVVGSSMSLFRAVDADVTGDIVPWATVTVQGGTVYKGSVWQLQNTAAPDIGIDAITWGLVGQSPTASTSTPPSGLVFPANPYDGMLFHLKINQLLGVFPMRFDVAAGNVWTRAGGGWGTKSASIAAGGENRTNGAGYGLLGASNVDGDIVITLPYTGLYDVMITGYQRHGAAGGQTWANIDPPGANVPNDADALYFLSSTSNQDVRHSKLIPQRLLNAGDLHMAYKAVGSTSVGVFDAMSLSISPVQL